MLRILSRITYVRKVILRRGIWLLGDGPTAPTRPCSAPIEAVAKFSCWASITKRPPTSIWSKCSTGITRVEPIPSRLSRLGPPASGGVLGRYRPTDTGLRRCIPVPTFFYRRLCRYPASRGRGKPRALFGLTLTAVIRPASAAWVGQKTLRGIARCAPSACQGA